MKPTSPLSLLLFLSLTTAAPLPPRSKLHKDCLDETSCQAWLRESFSPKSAQTPPTRIPPSPHFPDHQLIPTASSPESHRKVEEAFNNAPLASPKTIPETVALSASRPLHTSYLLSISHSLSKTPSSAPYLDTSTSSSDALPSKPTSALPELREEDTLRYWATIPNHSEEKQEEGRDRTYTGTIRPIVMAREYSDLLVVAIVVLFLAAVVVMEAVEYLGDLRWAIHNRSSRRGGIYLEDKERVSFHGGKKSFSVQPFPMRYKTHLGRVCEEVEKAQYHD